MSLVIKQLKNISEIRGLRETEKEICTHQVLFTNKTVQTGSTDFDVSVQQEKNFFFTESVIMDKGLVIWSV